MLNFPHSIVGVKMEFECGLRGKGLTQIKEEINRMDHQEGYISVQQKLYAEAEFNCNLVKNKKRAYNTEYMEELLIFVNHRLDEEVKHYQDILDKNVRI